MRSSPGTSSVLVRVLVFAIGAIALTGITVYAVRLMDKPTLATTFVHESVSPNGYTAKYVVTNRDSRPVRQWTVEFQLPEGSEVATYWDAQMKRTGQHYTFTGTGAIPAGGTSSFGFTVKGSGAPADCHINGAACEKPVDRVPPSTPQNLRSTGKSVDSISLAWDPATDDVAVANYVIFSSEAGSDGADGRPVAKTDKTDTVISGLTPGTSYTFQVAAVDAAGNQSKFSDGLTIGTSGGNGSAKPGAPSGLHVVETDDSTVHLAWQAATGDVAVNEYRVYDGSDVVATSGSLSVIVTGLKAGSSHVFGVTAVDAGETESPMSNTVTVQIPGTPAPGGSASPSPSSSGSPAPPHSPAPPRSLAPPHSPVPPRSLAPPVPPASSSSLQQPTESIPASVSPTPTTSSSAPGQNADTLISRHRHATASSTGTDSSGKTLGAGNVVDGKTSSRWASGDNIDPSWIRLDLGGTARISRVKLTWDKACAKVYSVEVSADRKLWQSIAFVNNGDGGVDDLLVGGAGRYIQVVGYVRCGTSDNYSLREFEVFGTVDGATSPGQTPSAADTVAPSTPANLQVSDVTATGATLTWAPATDNVGVIGYDIYHDGNLLRSVEAPTTTVALTDLNPNTQYRLSVIARDKAGNASQASSTVPMTTLADGDTVGPSAPQALRVTGVGATSVSLAWSASTGGDGRIIYDIYTGGMNVGTVSGLSVTIAGLTTDTVHTFHVKARDVAGNNSPASNEVQARTTSHPTSTPSPSGSVPASIMPSASAPPAGSGTQLSASSIIAEDLKVPWGMAFLPGGDALVGERDTFTVFRISANGAKKQVGVVPGVTTTGGEGGLLGLALSPNFATDHLVYAYHSTATDNRIVRMRFVDDQLGPPEPLLTGIPRNKFHNGGRLIFGPDGMLYASTGDAQDGNNAQNRDSLGGKILRLTPDGKPAPGNPFPDSPMFSMGHRNVQGLWFDSHGRLWASELGNSQVDELNLIRAGGNYGWPTCEGACGKSGFIDPVHQWPVSQASPSGLTIVGDTIFMASLRGSRLWRMEINGSGVRAPAAFLVGTFGRLRTVLPAPDGSLWVTTSNTDENGRPRAGDDRILRIALVR